MAPPSRLPVRRTTSTSTASSTGRMRRRTSRVAVDAVSSGASQARAAVPQRHPRPGACCAVRRRRARCRANAACTSTPSSTGRMRRRTLRARPGTTYLNGILDRAHATPYAAGAARLPLIVGSSPMHPGKEADQLLAVTTPQSPTSGTFHPGKEARSAHGAGQAERRPRPVAAPPPSRNEGRTPTSGPRSMFRSMAAGGPRLAQASPAAWNHETPGDAGGLECVRADVGL